MMRIVDLTHYLEAGMPVYPGSPAPRFEETATIATDGYREKHISLCAHTGTHVDAPAHILKGAKTLDQLPADTYVGKALVLDCSASGKKSIDVGELRVHGDAIRKSAFLLLRTDWSRYWGDDAYFSDYPVLSPEGARWLAGSGVKGVGLDALSADPLDAAGLPVHHILLGAGMVIVENLTHLADLPTDGFIFSCLPLNIRGADGSPIRAVAVIP